MEEMSETRKLQPFDVRPKGWAGRYPTLPEGVPLLMPVGAFDVVLLCQTHPDLQARIIEEGFVTEDVTIHLGALVAYGLSVMGAAVGGDGAYLDGDGRYEAARLEIHPILGDGDDRFWLVDLNTREVLELDFNQVMRAAAAGYADLLEKTYGEGGAGAEEAETGDTEAEESAS